MDLQYKSECSALLENAKSVTASLWRAANDYAAEFEKKLLSFDFTPLDEKQCAMRYYAFIEDCNVMLEDLASISERASALYEELMHALEEINAAIYCSKDKAAQEQLENTRAELHDAQKILSLTAKVSDAYARFTTESEPLIMKSKPSAREIGAAARRYALLLLQNLDSLKI